jgi:hypothetical protein
MDAKRALFIAGGLVVLLLFGCASPNESANQQPTPPKQPGGDIGDSDISSPEPDELDDLLPEDDLLIPPLNDSDDANTSVNQSGSGSSDLKIDVSDLFVDEGSDIDYISEGDIIEPI